MQMKSTYKHNWHGDKYMRHGRDRANAAVAAANEEALAWLRANSVVVTGEWQAGWYAVGPNETPQGTTGGFGNTAPHHKYVDLGWSGFPGYHLGEQAFQMFYTDMVGRMGG